MKVSRKEVEANKNIHHVIHCLTAPPAQDDSEEEYEREEALSSALVSWGAIYGKDFMADLDDRIQEVVDEFVQRLISEVHHE